MTGVFPVRVDEGEEPTFSCATCGWTPGCTGTPAPLIWAVIRHWLVEHWDRCGPPRGWA
ncbi:MAG: hypothetical protein ACRDYA_16930 [Egibacteraceae bacterium]